MNNHLNQTQTEIKRSNYFKIIKPYQFIVSNKPMTLISFVLIGSLTVFGIGIYKKVNRSEGVNLLSERFNGGIEKQKTDDKSEAHSLFTHEELIGLWVEQLIQRNQIVKRYYESSKIKLTKDLESKINLVEIWGQKKLSFNDFVQANEIVMFLDSDLSNELLRVEFFNRASKSDLQSFKQLEEQLRKTQALLR